MIVTHIRFRPSTFEPQSNGLIYRAKQSSYRFLFPGKNFQWVNYHSIREYVYPKYTPNIYLTIVLLYVIRSPFALSIYLPTLKMLNPKLYFTMYNKAADDFGCKIDRKHDQGRSIILYHNKIASVGFLCTLKVSHHGWDPSKASTNTKYNNQCICIFMENLPFRKKDR